MGRRARRRTRKQPTLAWLGQHGTGDRFGPLIEAQVLHGPFAKLLTLHGVDTPEDLQRILIIPGRRRGSQPEDMLQAFRDGHGNDDTGLVDSIVLATTNIRWPEIARSLLRGLTDDGLLDDGHVNLLSMYFLEADSIFMTVPGPWLADFYLQQRGDDLGRLDPAKTYSVERRCSPHLRRWAAAQSAQSREGVARVLQRTLAMDSKHGGAAVLGLVDGTEHLDQDTALDLLEMAADWPAPTVRLAALKRLAARGLHSEALDRALTDRAANIRRWAARNRQTSLLVGDQVDPAVTGDAPAARVGPEQASLFA